MNKTPGKNANNYRAKWHLVTNGNKQVRCRKCVNLGANRRYLAMRNFRGWVRSSPKGQPSRAVVARIDHDGGGILRRGA
jgi:hypothetical protein